MKRTFWNTALCCGLALLINSAGLTAHGYQKRPAGKTGTAKGGDSAKGKPQSRIDTKPDVGVNSLAQRGGGGGKSGGRSGGSGGHSSGGGGSQRSGSGGGMHAPSIGGARPSSGSGHPQSSGNRTPSFSQPRSNGHSGGVLIHPQSGGRTGNHSGGQGSRSSQQGAIIQGTRNAQPQSGSRSSTRNSSGTH